MPRTRCPNFPLAIIKAHGDVYIVNDINEMQIVIANEKAGFHSSISMKEQPDSTISKDRKSTEEFF